MPQRKRSGAREWVDPNDAPELTDEFFANAEMFQGDTFVRRGPGRPRSAATKEQISVRLDPEVLAKLREAGPGWQSQINMLLRQALALDRVNAASRMQRAISDLSAQVAGKLATVPKDDLRRVEAADLPEIIRKVYVTLRDIALIGEGEPVAPKKPVPRSIARPTAPERQ